MRTGPRRLVASSPSAAVALRVPLVVAPIMLSEVRSAHGGEPVWVKYARRSQARKMQQQQQQQHPQAPALPFQYQSGGNTSRRNSKRALSILEQIGRMHTIRSIFQIDLDDEADVRLHFATLGVRCEVEFETQSNLKSCVLNVPIFVGSENSQQQQQNDGSHHSNSEENAEAIINQQRLVDALEASSSYWRWSTAATGWNGQQQQQQQNTYSTSWSQQPETQQQRFTYDGVSSSNNNTNSNNLRYFQVRGIVSTSHDFAKHLCFAHAAYVLSCIQQQKFTQAFEFGAFVFKDVSSPPLQNPGQDERDYPSWEEYVAACREYVNETTAARRQRAIELRQAKYTGGAEFLAEHFFQQVVRSEMSIGTLPASSPASVAQTLRLQEEPKMLQVRSAGNWLSVMRLPYLPHIHAVGVSKSKKNSCFMCCLHAIKLGKAYPEEMINNTNNSGSDGSPIKYPTARKVFELFGRVQAGGGGGGGVIGGGVVPLVHVESNTAYGMYQATATGTLPRQRQQEEDQEDQNQETKQREMISIKAFGNSRALAKTRVLSDYFEKARVHAPELDKFLEIVSDDSNNTIDAQDILHVVLPKRLRQRIADASAKLGPPSPADDAPSVGGDGSNNNQLSPEVKVEKSVLLLSRRIIRSAAQARTQMASALDAVANAEEDSSKAVVAEKRLAAAHWVHAEAKRKLLEMRSSSEYLEKFAKNRAKLPMATKKQEILDLLETNRVVVICGTTGCGKTTQVPQYILDHHIETVGDGAACSILVTQPRRISAMTIAERIASERCEPIGKSTGYAIRLDSRPGTNITLLTTGVLLQLIRVDPALTGVKYLIIDEIHERDLNCDFTLILAREALKLNPELKLICMSATLQSETFSKYFDGAPIVNVDGMLHPVKEIYLEDLPALAAKHRIRLPSTPLLRSAAQQNLRETAQQSGKLDPAALAATVDIAVALMPPQTSILIFVAGWKDILDAKAFCSRACATAHRHEYILLHSTVPKEEQMNAFRNLGGDRVKVVIATNIAESGITIDDVGAVIDCGIIKEMNYAVSENHQQQNQGQVFHHQHHQKKNSNSPPDENPAGKKDGNDLWTSIATTTAEGSNKKPQQQQKQAGGGSGDSSSNSEASSSSSSTASSTTTMSSAVFSLRSVFTSKANSIQRRGRAGRTRGGICFRLFTRRSFQQRREYQLPEMLRAPLQSVILQSVAMGHGDPHVFFAKALDPPSSKLIHHSVRQLRALGAIHDDYKLTWLGQWIVKMPTDPATAKMILIGAMLRCLDPILTVAAGTDVPILLRTLPLRDQVSSCRQQIGLSTLSDSVTDVMVTNAIARPESGAVPQPDEGAPPVPQNLVNWRSFEVLPRYKAQFFDILLSSGWRVVWKTLEQQQIQMQHNRDFSSLLAPENASSVPSRRYFFVDVSSASENAREIELVKAVVACALYPNVAVGEHTKKKKKWYCRTKHSRRIPLGNSCVPTYLKGEHVASSLHSRMFVYKSVLDLGNGEFLDGVTHTNVWALLLLAAGDDHVLFSQTFSLGLIDGWILFKSDPDTIAALKTLRSLLNRCFGRLLRISDHQAGDGDKKNNKRRNHHLQNIVASAQHSTEEGLLPHDDDDSSTSTDDGDDISTSSKNHLAVLREVRGIIRDVLCGELSAEMSFSQKDIDHGGDDDQVSSSSSSFSFEDDEDDLYLGGNKNKKRGTINDDGSYGDDNGVFGDDDDDDDIISEDDGGDA